LRWKYTGHPPAWEHPASTAAATARREEAANRLWIMHTNGEPTLANGWAGRARANTS
jgi:hypothetical protein